MSGGWTIEREGRVVASEMTERLCEAQLEALAKGNPGVHFIAVSPDGRERRGRRHDDEKPAVEAELDRVAGVAGDDEDHEVEGGKCPDCGAEATLRTCSVCDVEAWIIDCGHMVQPRPITSGRNDGTCAHEDFCESCAEIDADEDDDVEELEESDDEELDDAADDGAPMRCRWCGYEDPLGIARCAEHPQNNDESDSKPATKPSPETPQAIGRQWAERVADAALDASGPWLGSLSQAWELAGDADASVVMLSARHRWAELVEECRAEDAKNAEVEAVLEKHARAEAARSARPTTLESAPTARFFLGRDTNQVTYDTKKPEPSKWYFEPLDYDGDVLWSEPFDSKAEAEAASKVGGE